MKKLPDLEAWAIFATVAETGSFARAAELLGLSQGTVSKAVTRLEQRMQITLLHRTSRSMSLTESGAAALERAERILAEGEAVEAEVMERGCSLRGVIRMSAPMSFGLSQLAPLLPDFIAAHPEVQLDIQFDDKQVDLVSEGYDLALRIANLVDSSLLARRLLQVRLLLVGAPSYCARHGAPAHPQQLQGHQGLMYSYAPSGNSWRFRHAEHGECSAQMATLIQANNADALKPALEAGLGLAVLPEFLVWRELAEGRLQTVMDDWEVAPIALHLVTPPGRRRPLRVQTFMDYLAGRLREAPWAQPLVDD
ncbi:LysR family transcriptional regulator [Isoalcanivorax beigongshangi]|uniref:LysR substrate-binding domain-containing protein n=1 Tax=Isoalcanivorax beigongshangi TaxID=3238810 RepID=A0ABV4AKD0_9GAMM